MDCTSFPKKHLTTSNWKKFRANGLGKGTFDFPEGTKLVNPNLNAESVLPEDILSEESGKIRNQQNEWAYRTYGQVMGIYLLELDELKKRSVELTQYRPAII